MDHQHIRKAIALTAHCLISLREIPTSIISTQRHIALKKWLQLLGKLWYMDLANQARLATNNHTLFQDFKRLIEDVGTHPTDIAEIVPNTTTST
jgi:hypothetical protein